MPPKGPPERCSRQPLHHPDTRRMARCGRARPAPRKPKGPLPALRQRALLRSLACDCGYQIFTRTESGRYILSPGFTPKAS
jgi:hypothetical protein